MLLQRKLRRPSVLQKGGRTRSRCVLMQLPEDGGAVQRGGQGLQVRQLVAVVGGGGGEGLRDGIERRGIALAGQHLRGQCRGVHPAGTAL